MTPELWSTVATNELKCDCEFCKAEERLSESEFDLFGKILEKAAENGWTLPLDNLSGAEWNRFIKEDVVGELEQRKTLEDSFPPEEAPALEASHE